MAQISTYIIFNGNCREAMCFYENTFGGILTMQSIKGTPLENHCGADMENMILHATLAREGLVIMGSDMPDTERFIRGNSICLSVECSNELETVNIFSKLAADGRIEYPLNAAFWGGFFGVVTDRFGVRWLIS